MSKPTYKRSARVSDQMHHEIADIFARKLKDPRVGFVTVTGVDLSNDLRNAKIFVSIYSGDKEETLKGIKSASAFIRSELARRMRMKFVPELLFRVDESAERGAHLMEMLESLHTEKGKTGSEDE